MSEPLDNIDREILALLRQNARISNKALAEQLGMAPSSCLERVRKLESRGVLTGYHAAVNTRALGIGMQAMVSVQLAEHRRENVESLKAHFLTLPEVMSIFHVAGGTDFLVHVVVRDSDHLRELALHGFTSRPEVRHIETGLIFETVRSMKLPFFSASDPA